MKTKPLLYSFWLCASLLFGILPAGSTEPSSSPTEPGKYRVSGPHTHRNLTVYFLHGQSTGRDFLTLEEALKSGKVRVRETENVNQLAIENLSSQEVFVQSGDIVKGGKQDRTLAFDLILPPKSGEIPIDSFCVEQGRWSRRGNESQDQFAASSESLSSKDLKMAAKSRRNQGEVWGAVAAIQDRLEKNLAAPVKARESESSLQLTLESGKVRETVEDYLRALSKAPDGKADVIGYAFFINGELNSVELYSSASLFGKLWPKLLKASAIEALSAPNPDGKYAKPNAAVISQSLTQAENAKPATREISPRTRMLTFETSQGVLFETWDPLRKEWVHKNYLVK